MVFGTCSIEMRAQDRSVHGWCSTCQRLIHPLPCHERVPNVSRVGSRTGGVVFGWHVRCFGCGGPGLHCFTNLVARSKPGLYGGRHALSGLARHASEDLAAIQVQMWGQPRSSPAQPGCSGRWVWLGSVRSASWMGEQQQLLLQATTHMPQSGPRVAVALGPLLPKGPCSPASAELAGPGLLLSAAALRSRSRQALNRHVPCATED
jgi:hypothetical protein